MVGGGVCQGESRAHDGSVCIFAGATRCSSIIYRFLGKLDKKIEKPREWEIVLHSFVEFALAKDGVEDGEEKGFSTYFSGD